MNEIVIPALNLTARIEYPKGSIRSGTNAEGVSWSNVMENDYGHLTDYKSADGEEMDVLLGDNVESPLVFVVNQLKPNGDFDEHKVLIGFNTIDEARDAYYALNPTAYVYPPHIATFWCGHFLQWLQYGDKSAEVYNYRKVDAEACSECGAMHERGDDGHCNQCGAVWPSEVSGMDEIQFLLTDSSEYQILSDSEGILRVRHLLTIADRKNLNNRIYPKQTLADAITDANRRAKAGAMLAEYVHPEAAVTYSGSEEFVDNPDRKCARIDYIYPPDEQGRVYGDVTLLDTEFGRDVAKKYKEKKNVGVSMRFKMQGRVAMVEGEQTQIATNIYICTFDFVNNPAVAETSRDWKVLSDSALQEAGLPPSSKQNQAEESRGIFTPASSLPENSTNVSADAESRRGVTFMDTLKKKLSALFASIAGGIAGDDYKKRRSEIATLIAAAADEGHDVQSFTEQLLRADELTLIPGNKTGSMEPGANPDIEPSAATGSGHNSAAHMSDANVAFIEQMRQKAEADAAEATRLAAVDAAIADSGELLGKLPLEAQEKISALIRKTAKNAEDAKTILAAQVDAVEKILVAERLKNAGTGEQGRTVENRGGVTFHGSVQVNENVSAPFMKEVDGILNAADDYKMRTQAFNPTENTFLRKENRKLLDKVIEAYATDIRSCKNVQEWVAKEDALSNRGARAFGDEIMKPMREKLNGGLAADTALVSNFYNQPTIMMALLILSYWDSKFLQWTDVIGPQNNTGMGGFENYNRYGRVLRLPVEFYSAPTGYGTYAGPTAVEWGVPENTGIPEASMENHWLTFGGDWRRIAFSVTADLVKDMGDGPINYPVIARFLANIALHRERVTDRALANEFCKTSDEYNAVAVEDETPNVTNNSVYEASAGNVTVNLNPAKIANAAVAATDLSVVYGTASSGNNAIGAIRLATRGNVTSAPYAGTDNGVDPVVPWRTKYNLDVNGGLTTTQKNAVTVDVTGATAAILGYLDDDGNVRSIPGVSGTANCAVDWNNGVLVFTAGFDAYVANSGVAALDSGAGVTVSYSYVVNHDIFNISDPTIPTGKDIADYYNGLVRQFDSSAATMGAAPRYNPPNLALMSLNAAVRIKAATIFNALQSTPGTSLRPTEQYFAERDNIPIAKHNTPWYWGDGSIWLGKNKSTKYGIETPHEVKGPFPTYDANGLMVDAEKYYLRDRTVIATPQVEDADGNIFNPVSRRILFR